MAAIPLKKTLDDWRKISGYSQAGIARELNLNQGTFSQILNYGRYPKKISILHFQEFILKKLTDLGVPVAEPPERNFQEKETDGKPRWPLAKWLCYDAKISQGRLSAECGISQPAVAQYLRGWLPENRQSMSYEKFQQVIILLLGQYYSAPVLDDLWKPMAADEFKIFRQKTREKEVNRMLTQEALRHYKFNRNPFAVDESLKTEEMFFGEKHREILDRIVQAMQGQKFFILYGETGIGKTLLQKKARNLLWRIPLEDKDRVFSLEELEELPRISADKRAYLIVEPENIMAQSAAANNFLNLLLLELGVGNLRQDGLEKALILKKALLSRKQAVILWIDEGNQMSPGTLQSLKAFFELEDRETDKRLLTVIVAGQPVGLEDKIQFLPTLQEVGLRATQDCLKPLEKTDAENFIASRLALVGRKPNDIFTDEALSAILDMADRYGGRTPARINRIATAALLWKYTYNPNASVVGLHEVLA